MTFSLLCRTLSRPVTSLSRAAPFKNAELFERGRQKTNPVQDPAAHVLLSPLSYSLARFRGLSTHAYCHPIDRAWYLAPNAP